MGKKIEIFCCYAHEDRSLLEQLRAQLSLLERQESIAIWSDADISPGAVQLDEITRHLNTAQIVLLLVSPDFMKSDDCYTIMQRTMKRQKKERTVRVIPVILRPVDWQKAPIAELKVLPTGAKPVTLWDNRDSAFLDVAKGIRHAAESLRQPGPLPHERSKPANMGNLNRFSQVPQTPTYSPSSRGVKPVKRSNTIKNSARIPARFPILIIIVLIGIGFIYIPQLMHSSDSNSLSNIDPSLQSATSTRSNSAPVTSSTSTPSSIPTSGITNISENRKLLCTACGDPALRIVLDNITIDTNNITTILNFTITNTRTASCALGFFSTLQLQDPEGHEQHSQQNNKISIASNSSVKDHENFSNFIPIQDTQYTLNVTFAHYIGCTSSNSGDNFYQNENFLFSASQTTVKSSSSIKNVAEKQKLLCTACGDPALRIVLDSITIDSSNITTILNFTIMNMSTTSCVLGFFSTLQLQDPEGHEQHLQQYTRIPIASNNSIKDFENFNNFTPVGGTQYTLNVVFSHYIGCASSGDNRYQNITLTF